MAYQAPTIVDRVALGDDKYIITDLPDGRKLLTPSPDSVTETGTEINKALLQPLCDAVEEHDARFPAVDQSISNAINTATSDNPNGWQTQNITAADFKNKEAILAVPHKRFILYVDVAIRNTTLTSEKTEKYSKLIFCDLNTQTMIAFDSKSAGFTIPAIITIAHVYSGTSASYEAYLYLQLVPSGVRMYYTGYAADGASVSGTLKYLQI